MTLQSSLLLLIAVALALALVYYQYIRGKKDLSTWQWALAGLRFLSYLAIAALLINPKIVSESYRTQKANLVMLFDNSLSIKYAGVSGQVSEIMSDLKSNDDLKDRFNIVPYAFGKDLELTDSLDFSEKATDINNALERIRTLHSNEPTAVLLVSDGNQTLGQDYEFLSFPEYVLIYSLLAGDTTTYEDTRLDQVNLNKYTFLGNSFPVECFYSYDGSGTIETELTIALDDRVVYRKPIALGGERNSGVINATLVAPSVGLKEITIDLRPGPGERNTANNTRKLTVEVLDEKTRIGIVSGISHPDIGALRKAIEANEQRSATIMEPREWTLEQDDFDILILYQPDASFRPVYDHLRKTGGSYMTVMGRSANWRLVNDLQSTFTFSNYGQTEEALPILNSGFSYFDLGTLSVADYPPLQVELGELLITKPHEHIMEQQIRGVAVKEPLFTLIQDGERKEALINGENIWKWRLQAYRESQDFESFDGLIGQVMRFLTSNSRKQRLVVDYNNTYQGYDDFQITARYFDPTFSFEPDASLGITVRSVNDQSTRSYTMLLGNGYYEADLSDLEPGQYEFTVKVENAPFTASGAFSILDYDVEKQLITASKEKLGRLASSNKGGLFYPEQVVELVDELRQNEMLRPIQKSDENVLSLVDYKILLGILAFTLASEWFLRKYHGLI